MFHIGVVLALVVTGQAPVPQASPSAEPAAAITNSPDTAKSLAEYNAMHEKAGNSAAAHWRLGLWCEKHGLSAEALVQFGEVARLDPRREAVWRKLGFKKVNGRWTTDEHIAAEKAQAAADRLWGPRLKKLHRDIHGTNGNERQEKAQIELDAIKDPLAALCLYREFSRGRLDQSVLIAALERIESPMATRLLAYLSVYGAAPEVRKQATLILRQRQPSEYLEFLVGLMVDPLKFEVRHVAGPGSPGILFVEGEQFNSARFYSPPAAPNVGPMPGDVISFGPSGSPTIYRPVASNLESSTKGVPGSKELVERKTTETRQYAVISPEQLQQEARRGANSAEAQLRADEREIRAINTSRREFNDLVMAVARDATGKDLGSTPGEWRDGLAGVGKQSPPASPGIKPTVPEQVPLVYNPWFGPIGVFTQSLARTQILVDT